MKWFGGFEPKSTADAPEKVRSEYDDPRTTPTQSGVGAHVDDGRRIAVLRHRDIRTVNVGFGESYVDAADLQVRSAGSHPSNHRPGARFAPG